ncbi:MAG: glycosyltransferase family 2 protein [Nitrospirota bacterium]
MKVSIITAVFNNKACIEDCIKSVSGQTYKDIEYIIIDGESTDGTVDIIKEHGNGISKWISKPDKGIYDALNKGLRLATGDIVGFLHADDLYADKRVIERVVSEMTKHNVDSCYGDLLYVDKHDIEKIIRFWKSCNYASNLFYRGWMPPHPSFFVKKKIYDNYGYFNTGFRIAADYELMLRFLVKHKITTHYIPEVLIKMRVGGASNRSLKNIVIKTAEDYKAWKINNLDRKFYTIPFKNISKLPQFFKR